MNIILKHSYNFEINYIFYYYFSNSSTTNIFYTVQSLTVRNKRTLSWKIRHCHLWMHTKLQRQSIPRLSARVSREYRLLEIASVHQDEVSGSLSRHLRCWCDLHCVQPCSYLLLSTANDWRRFYTLSNSCRRYNSAIYILYYRDLMI